MLAGQPTTETYQPPSKPGAITLRATREIYPWGAWWAVVGIITVLAAIAAGVAIAWTARRD